MSLKDEEFLLAFERGSLSSADFRHRDHLRMAYLYLRDDSNIDGATTKIVNGIKNFAAAKGAQALFHETITRFWVGVTATAMRETRATSFEDLIASHPGLLDKNLLSKHWSTAALGSQRARNGWIEPDIQSVPF